MTTLVTRTLGRRIRKTRMLAGMTLEQLAHVCGLQPAELELIETNLHLPEEEEVGRIAAALGKPAELFIHHTDYGQRRLLQGFLAEYPEPPVNVYLKKHLKAVKAWAPALYSQLTQKVERRLDLPDLGSALCRQPCAHRRDALFLLHAVAAGGDALLVRPMKLGLQYQAVVDKEEGRQLGGYPHSALAVSLDRHDVLLVPDITMMYLHPCQGTHVYTISCLAIVGDPFGVSRFAVGICLGQSPGHGELTRESTGLTILELDDEELLKPDFMDRLDERLGELMCEDLDFQIGWSEVPVMDRFVERSPEDFISRDDLSTS